MAFLFSDDIGMKPNERLIWESNVQNAERKIVHWIKSLWFLQKQCSCVQLNPLIHLFCSYVPDFRSIHWKKNQFQFIFEVHLNRLPWILHPKFSLLTLSATLNFVTAALQQASGGTSLPWNLPFLCRHGEPRFTRSKARIARLIFHGTIARIPCTDRISTWKRY